MRTELKTTIPAQIADLTNQIAELTQIREKFEADNAEAIEKVVKERVAAIETAPAPSDASIEEAVRVKVAAAEATFATERDAAIATAVASATASLQADLATVRAELATASSAAPTDSTNTEELNKVKADFETTKKLMEDEFEQVKGKLIEEAKAREKEITDRLTAEIKKAAESATGSAAPPVDVDALIKTKLDALEGQRAAEQKKAVDDAVAKTTQEQEELFNKKLVEAKASITKEAAMRTTLLTTKLKQMETKLKAATSGAAPASTAPASGLPAKPTPATSTPAASTSTGSPPAASNGQPATRGRGAARGAARGGRGGGNTGRGGGAAGSTTSTATPTTSATPATGLSLRGAATAQGGARPPGGVLGNLLSSALGGKRARDDDAAGDSPKKPKPGSG